MPFNPRPTANRLASTTTFPTASTKFVPNSLEFAAYGR